MSHKRTFVDKLNTFIFGEPIPVLSQNDLETIHHLDDKLNKLLALLDGAQPRHDPTEATVPSSPDSATLDDLAEQVRKLAKTQFKANTLQETQLARHQEIAAGLKETVEQQEKRLTDLSAQQQQAVEAARLDVLKDILPVLDSLDAAFESGRRQVLKQPMPGETRQAIIAWLDGIRLARLRLLDVLQSYDVTPIPAVGEQFDPDRHVAVATGSGGDAPEGTILGEDRRGYMTPNEVLRFAEVVVSTLK